MLLLRHRLMLRAAQVCAIVAGCSLLLGSSSSSVVVVCLRICIVVHGSVVGLLLGRLGLGERCRPPHPCSSLGMHRTCHLLLPDRGVLCVVHLLLVSRRHL